jgi:hypothetical protein
VRATGADVRADAGAEVELWAPGDTEPQVGGDGIAGVEAARAGRGWRVTAETCAPDYRLVLTAAGTPTPTEPAEPTEPVEPAPSSCG